MPADQQSLRRTCGRFIIMFTSFMTKRANLASSAFRHYTSKARSARVQCVLLVTVLLQVLLCANDIEMNPGPSESETVTVSSDSETDMKAYMQDLLKHQEVRIQTLLQQQLNVRFGVLENHLTEKIDESMTAVKTEIEGLHAETCQLENCCAALQETESTKAAVTAGRQDAEAICWPWWQDRQTSFFFFRRDNLKFFNVPMSVSNENYADRVDKIVDILSDRKRVHVCFERYKQHAQAANFKIGTRPGPCLRLLFRYPFHPRLTAVARKRPRSFCQKRRWQVTAKHAYTLRMWLCMKWHGT